MFVQKLIPLLATVGVALADCSSSDPKKIDNESDLAELTGCPTWKGSVSIGNGTGNSVDLSGKLKEITGDLVIENNKVLSELTSSSLSTIGGTFRLASLEALGTLSMTSLSSVDAIDWSALNSVSNIDFGNNGIQKVGSLTISDTFLTSLEGLDIETVNSIDINNNRRLVKWSSSLETVNEELALSFNGQTSSPLMVELPNLKWAKNLNIRAVGSFEVPSLEVINQTLAFTENTMKSFSAPNLTTIKSGDFSFINNTQIANITAPQLTKIGGALSILANNKLTEIDGFPKVQSVSGAVKVTGAWKSFDLPKLNNVVGTFTLSSSEKISDVCDDFKKQAPGSQGGNGDIQGEYTCTSENEKSKSDTSSPDGSGDGGNVDGSDDESAAGYVGINLSLALGAAALALLA